MAEPNRVIIEPTQKILKETFSYDKELGVFRWILPKISWIKAGDIAGYYRKDGYYVVFFGGKSHLGHRLIFLYYHGNLPVLIDHIDQNPRNNQIENLRESTKKLNAYNSKMFKHNTSGIKGVSWDTKQQIS